MQAKGQGSCVVFVLLVCCLLCVSSGAKRTKVSRILDAEVDSNSPWHFLNNDDIIRKSSFASMRKATGAFRDISRTPVSGSDIQFSTALDSAKLQGDVHRVFLNETQLPFHDLFHAVNIMLPLALPTGDIVNFDLQKTSVLPASLSEQFPELVSYSGPSVERELQMHAVVDFSPEKGLRAYVHSPGHDYWIDPIFRAEQVYQVYSTQASAKKLAAQDVAENSNTEYNSSWTCGGRENTTATGGSSSKPELWRNSLLRTPMGRSPRQESSKPVAEEFTFVIAFVANGQYSQYHGNTIQSVLAEILTLANRINGILRRELGVTFQLHPKTADLICLFPCSNLRNSYWVLDDMYNYLGPTKRVSSSSYHLAHALTTASGGLACLNVLCNSQFSHCGTTGLQNPITDAFYVDYVLHEIGHQMGATHTFDNCDGLNSNRASQTAVEPGSGSTVLGYAGLCGESDLQKNSDPYFHSITLEQMRNVLWSVTGPDSSCGTYTEIEVPGPEVLIEQSCVLPAKTPFQINFALDKNSNASPAISLYYSIDELEPSASIREYTSRSTPRFRSWEPTENRFRSFPNMYYLSNSIKGYDEVLPSLSSNMTFRATVRQVITAQNDDIAEGYVGLGSFAFKDVEVQFIDSNQPLGAISMPLAPQIDSKAIIMQGSQTLVTWEPGDSFSLSNQMEILIAKNTMSLIGSSISSYSEDVHALNWYSLGIVPNNGTSWVDIPRLITSVDAGDLTPAILMIRQPVHNDQACFFFQILPGLYLVDPTVAPSIVPTLSPSLSPTQSPTTTSSKGSPSNTSSGTPNVISISGVAQVRPYISISFIVWMLVRYVGW